MNEKKSDPTKDPEFQKVVQTFLRTPPQPHKAPEKGKKRKARTMRKQSPDDRR
jgi:hypothetical protein